MDFEIIHRNQVDSTNDFALQLIEKGVVNEGVVIWANEQLTGRGYGSNRWESEKDKNLLCSIVLKPAIIHPSDQFLITQIVSVSLINMLHKTIPNENFRIKWPNDIYVDGKKISGILIQNIIKGQSIEYSIIGIGLNVNQDVFYSDASNPVSINEYTSRKLSIENLLNQLLIEIDTIYSGIASQLYQEKIMNAYLEKLYLRDQWAEYKTAGDYFRAKIIGIGQYGRLVLKMENGDTRNFDFKEVELVNS